MRSAVVALTIAALLVGCSSGSTVTTSTPHTTPAPPTTDTGTTAASTTVPVNTLVPAAADVKFTPFVTGISNPVELAWRKGDTALYLAQQDGKILSIRNGLAGTPVLDIAASITFGGEQGLLGLAFHPTKPLAYIDYTNTAGNTVIAEYAVADNGTFDPASARTVLTIDQPYPNHNGGKVVFGPDGYLYIGMGDGGAAGDPERRALDKSVLLGKILRIDPIQSGGQPYTVPSDNPYVSTTGARAEVWSTGVRNPWRFTFDRATGDLWIADVGQNLWEEVDFVPATNGKGAGKGTNFGWSAFEATHRFNADQPADGVTPPIFEYAHGDDGCSISGGAVYRGATIPSLVGWFVFSDYCSGAVWAARRDGKVVSLGKLASVSAIAEGPDGEVYVLAYSEGTIYRIDPA